MTNKNYKYKKNKTKKQKYNNIKDNKDNKDMKDNKLKYNNTIFMFRRDYRIFDNTTLIKASKNSNNIIPIFIFTYNQIRDNKIKSDNCVKFLVESLEELNEKDLNNELRIYYGDEYKILDKLLKNNKIDCIAFNKDYTSYSIDRDDKIAKMAKKYNVDILSEHDIVLYPFKSILTTGKTVYTKFTPFYKNAISKEPPEINKYKIKNIASKKKVKLSGLSEYTASLASFYDINKIAKDGLIEKPGRIAALQILKEIKNNKWDKYDKCRNMLTYKTTQLSAYNKFGCVSIREVYNAVKDSKAGKQSDIIKQLIWRDFFYTLSFENPEIYNYNNNGVLNKNIKWKTNKEELQLWKDGKTGYPIVDACMRELNNTGYLHNRGRLIVSNFLTRLLHQNWHEGELYFAQKLYDYDPSQNSFGWQISASISGTESRPISQMIYNPWIQSKKYDPDAEYIKKWIPELKNIDSNKIHKWDKYCHDYKDVYIKPIINYETERKYNLNLIK